MATSKQPKFPHPPLEIGVPQYPTPNVPDFSTRDGHIILVEKVSSEKGGYTPQPLDGSIIYKKRDANKWPSTLYLVYQKPTEDGEHVYNYWANDRTLASQDPWNYGLSYQDEHPDYPIITRLYIVPRSQYAPVAIGSVDPVFGGNASITKQQMAELGDENPLRSRYVQVQRVYETIPGPVVSGKQYDDFFQQNLSISKQIVASGAEEITPYDGLLSYKDEPIDSTKSQRIIVEAPSLPPTRTEYKTGTYNSPTLVFDIIAESAQLGCNGVGSDIRIKLTPVTRASQSRQTIFKTISSYSYGPPEPGDSGLLSPELKEVAFTGFVINFNLGGALCDHIVAPSIGSYLAANQIRAGTLCTIVSVGTTNFVAIGAASNTVGVTFTATGPASGDGIVTIAGATGIVVNACGVVESWDIPATTPTATEYSALIGTYQKISWESRYWKSNIWESKEVWVKVV